MEKYQFSFHSTDTWNDGIVIMEAGPDKHTVGVRNRLAYHMIERERGIPSQLCNWMYSTEMCLPHLTQPLWIREVRGLPWVSSMSSVPWEQWVNCLAQGQNGRFEPCQHGDSNQPSSYWPNALTTTLPAAPPNSGGIHALRLVIFSKQNVHNLSVPAGWVTVVPGLFQ